MKKRLPGAASLAGLLGAYLVLRYPLFFLHGMKDWPLVLFAAGAVVILFSSFSFGCKMLPFFTVFGYMIGFILGYIFQMSSNAGLNNLWVIWTCAALGSVLLGAAAEIFYNRRTI